VLRLCTNFGNWALELLQLISWFSSPYTLLLVMGLFYPASAAVAKPEKGSQPYPLPLWERVARMISCEPGEGLTNHVNRLRNRSD